MIWRRTGSRRSRRPHGPSRGRRLMHQWLEHRRLMAADGPLSWLPIDDVTVEVGSPLHVPIDVLNGGDQVVTTTVTVDDPSQVEATVLTGNRSIRIDVVDFGVMTFQLFEDRAPVATARVIELAQAGFYDGILFHRVVNGFVIQAGDPTATGTGGSPLPDFDDQFHPDLQHNRDGILSFAKTSDDTNDSQFFITEAATRHLDFNHSIFGQMVQGWDVREAISNVAVNDPTQSRPIDDVVIRSIDVFEDTENSIVMLRGLVPGATTRVHVRVHRGDESLTQSFTVRTTADVTDAQPYLMPLPRSVLAAVDTPATVNLAAVDLESDRVVYFGQYAGDPRGSTATLDPVTGLLRITPAAGFTGEIAVLVAARQIDGGPGQFDSQLIRFEFIDSLPPPAGVDLIASSDSGRSDRDDLSRDRTPRLEVTGVTAGATVHIIDAATDVVLAQGVATGDRIMLQIADPSAQGGGEGLSGGTHTLVARQSLGEIQSPPSPRLEIRIDATSPTLLRTGLIDHVFAGSLLRLPLAADEQDVTWRLIEDRPGGAIDAATGELTYRPAVGVQGRQSLSIELTDAAGNTRTETIDIRVTPSHQNARDRFDVDDSGLVTAQDALLIINLLNRAGGAVTLPEPDGVMTPLGSRRYFNVNADTQISAQDALLVINELGRRGRASRGDAEGPAGWSPPSLPLPPPLPSPLPSLRRDRDTDDRWRSDDAQPPGGAL